MFDWLVKLAAGNAPALIERGVLAGVAWAVGKGYVDNSVAGQLATGLIALAAVAMSSIKNSTRGMAIQVATYPKITEVKTTDTTVAQVASPKVVLDTQARFNNN